MGIHFSHFQITCFTIFQTHLQNAFFTLFHYSFSKRFSLYHIFTFFAKSILKMRLEKCEQVYFENVKHDEACANM